MLGSYRGNLQPPDISELDGTFANLLNARICDRAAARASRADWTPKEKARILEALRGAERYTRFALKIGPVHPMPAAAMQLVRAALEQCGRFGNPLPASALQTLAEVHVALASSRLLIGYARGATCPVSSRAFHWTAERGRGQTS